MTSKATQPKTFYALLGLVFFMSLVFLLLTGQAARTAPSDAIAIRVVSNNDEHWGVREWYENRGFAGSPQSLTVDGYEAIRDGRTVYVNVANVSGGTMYTNVYLISYTQAAEPNTIDIFGNILKNWKFNTNLVEQGLCRANKGIKCARSEDCPIGDVCDSIKARAVRDLKRLGDAAAVKQKLDEYRQKNGAYPTLSAGTYIQNFSVSVWPSWADNLFRELAVSPRYDPVNRLGDCPGYNAETCWNEQGQSFVSDLSNLEFPDNSLAYVYQGNDSGTAGAICVSQESPYAIYNPPACSIDVCLDFDGDGYGFPASGLCANGEADCNDSDPNIQTGSTEDCEGGLDEDCDGLVDCFDNDCSLDSVCASFVCSPNGCGNGCPAGCTVAEDPDCACELSGNGCCPAGCDASTDVDCAIVCVPDGCNGNCPTNCSLAEDPDCGCGPDAFGCCPPGCDRTLGDTDCPEICADADGDGHAAIDAALCPSGDDCDDRPAGEDGIAGTADDGVNIYPGNPEVCDGVDNDCDTFTDEDFTQDECEYNCLFTWTGNGGLLNCCGNDPNEGGPYQAFENTPLDYCSDGNDNDCDGDIDGEDPDCTTACADSGENNWTVAGESDCDQCNLAGSQDGDQNDDWGAYNSMKDQCDSDCGITATHIDTSADYEDGNEITCDGLDNDCDGDIDEGLAVVFYVDSDGDGFGSTTDTQMACPGSPPAGYVADNSDCDDDNNGINPGAGEVCTGGLDEDCDGLVDCADDDCLSDPACGPGCTDADGDQYVAEADTSGCAGDVCGPFGSSPCLGGNDCDPSRSYIYPYNPSENCDGWDNDCNGDTDEGCDDDSDGYCDDSKTYFDNFSVSPFLASPCQNTTDLAGDPMDCDDENDNIYEGAPEICGNGVDENCDGTPDDGCTNQCVFDFVFPCEF